MLLFLVLEVDYVLLFQMIGRIEYFHNKNFIHRDIKPDNFLMGISKSCNKVHPLLFHNIMSVTCKHFIISANGIPLETVDDFKYLGSWVNSTNQDIGVRKSMAWKALNGMNVVWWWWWFYNKNMQKKFHTTFWCLHGIIFKWHRNVVWNFFGWFLL